MKSKTTIDHRRTLEIAGALMSFMAGSGILGSAAVTETSSGARLGRILQIVPAGGLFLAARTFVKRFESLFGFVDFRSCEM